MTRSSTSVPNTAAGEIKVTTHFAWQHKHVPHAHAQTQEKASRGHLTTQGGCIDEHLQVVLWQVRHPAVL